MKKAVLGLRDVAQDNYKLMLSPNGKEPHEVPLNRVFVGNPGTGKTTVAEIYGSILKELRFLTDGEVVSKFPSDFIGSVVGESAKNTDMIMKMCENKVLLIDEAYGLDDQNYGKQALDTITAKILVQPIAVILCGYEKDMDKMMRNQNPGLKRRFNYTIPGPIKFDDFNDQELMLILMRKAKAMKLTVRVDTARKVIKDVLAKQRNMANFGNAGVVGSMLKSGNLNMTMRLKEKKGSIVDETLLYEDLTGKRKSENENEDPFAELLKLSNTEGIIKQLKKIEQSLIVWKREGGGRPKLNNFRFVGNPGTGKTTIANAMGLMLHNLGILARDHVEVTTGLKLQGSYLGQTKDKVIAVAESAAGGVLFIDEAYDLGQGQYGSEAVNTLLKLMLLPM